MAKRKTSLPAVTQAAEKQAEPAQVKVAEPVKQDDGIQWVTVEVPVVTGSLGNANVPDQMFVRLQGQRAKETAKRIARGLEHVGAQLLNGKKCSGAAQDVGSFVLEAVAKQLCNNGPK